MCESVPAVDSSSLHQEHHLPYDDKHGFSVHGYIISLIKDTQRVKDTDVECTFLQR